MSEEIYALIKIIEKIAKNPSSFALVTLGWIR